jgi:hypothetical protein
MRKMNLQNLVPFKRNMNFMSTKVCPIASEQEIQELLKKARGRNSERSVRDELTNSLKVNFHIGYQAKLGEERHA